MFLYISFSNSKENWLAAIDTAGDLNKEAGVLSLNPDYHFLLSTIDSVLTDLS